MAYIAWVHYGTSKHGCDEVVGVGKVGVFVFPCTWYYY